MKKKPDVISEADIVIKIWGMAQASIKQRNSPCADNIVRQDTFKWAFAEFSRIRLKDLEQAKAEVAEDIGGLICCLAGNLMMEDKEAGTLLAQQLQPLIDTIKLRYLPRKEMDK